LQVPPEIKDSFAGKKGSGKKDQFFHTCESVSQWCRDKLLATPRAQEYLLKRKFGQDEWKRFMIGYFPGGSRAINRLLQDMSKHNVLAKDLVSAGIIAQGRSSLYSPFEERILFPIRDVLGRCCGFGGRIFSEHDDRAKYYNSKESEWFLKGQMLFGLDLAKKEMQYSGKAFLVEGYTDCVAMVKHGYKNTVATLGTACTADHLKILSRYSKVLYVLYDGDSAGQAAILRLTKLCWDANLDLQIITLPKNQDPASFLENSGDINKLIESSLDIFTFFVNSLGGQFWGKSLSEKIELCEKIVQVIVKVDDNFKRDLLLQKASDVMQVPFDTLKSMVVKDRKKKPEQPFAPSAQGAYRGVEQNMPVEEHITAISINSLTQEKLLFVDEDLLSCFSPFIRNILQKFVAFTKVNKRDSRTLAKFLDYLESDDDRDWVIQRSFMVDDESPELMFEKLQFRFRKKNWKKIVLGIKKQIFTAKQESDSDKLKNLLSSFLSLKQEMKERGLI